MIYSMKWVSYANSAYRQHDLAVVRQAQGERETGSEPTVRPEPVEGSE